MALLPAPPVCKAWTAKPAGASALLVLSCPTPCKKPERHSRGRTMAKFIIQPHGRLQEWIADHKGYFRDEGLDYEFQAGRDIQSQKRVDTAGRISEVRTGAFESYRAGGATTGVHSDISCACHWAVGRASSAAIC